MTPVETKPSKLFRQYQISGDSEVLGRTYDLIAPDFLTLVVHITGCADAAEDLVQEVFLDAIEQGGQWGEGVALETWLAELLAHRLDSFERKRSQAPTTSGLDEARTMTMRWTPLSEAQRVEIRDQLKSAVANLPQKYLDVVQLGVLEGLNSLEIGRQLDRSPATVRSQLARGLEKLRGSLPAALGTLLFVSIADPASGGALKASATVESLRLRLLENTTRIQTVTPASAVKAGNLFLKWAVGGMLTLAVAFWAMDSTQISMTPVLASNSMDMAQVANPDTQPLMGPSFTDSDLRQHAGIGTPQAPAARAHVFGRVLDTDGRPIEGAEVTLFTWREGDAPEGTPEINDEGVFGYRLQTGPSGQFTFDIQLPSSGSPSLHVEAGPNYTASNLWFNTTFCNQAPLWSGENPIGPVYLQHAGQLSGTILTDAGLPAYPAHIIVSPGATAGTGSMVSTQPDGSFMIARVLVGQQVLIVQYQDQVRATESILVKRDESEHRLNIRMPATESLRVEVCRLDGTPLPGAMLQFAPIAAHSTSDLQDIGLRTDPRGSATIQVLKRRNRALFVNLKGFISEQPYYQPKAQQGSLKVRMTRTYSQSFRAIDFNTGQTLSDFMLTPQSLAEGKWVNSRASESEAFDDTGAKTIATKDGEWVVIWAQGYESQRRDPRACRERTSVVALRPLMKIAGRVMHDGLPVPQAKLELAGSVDTGNPGSGPDALRARFTSRSNAMDWLETDANGHFEFTAFSTPNLTYRLNIQATDGAAIEHWFRLQDFQGNTAELGDLELQETGRLEVSVQVPTGLDLAGLVFILDLPHGVQVGRVNTKGRFKLQGIVPGVHKLHLRRNPDFHSDTPEFSFEVIAGETTSLAIDLRPFGLSYQDLLLLDGGMPMVDCKVFLSPVPPLSAGNPTSWKGGYFGVTDQQGRLYGRVPAAGLAEIWVYRAGQEAGKQLAPTRVMLSATPQGLITVTF